MPDQSRDSQTKREFTRFPTKGSESEQLDWMRGQLSLRDRTQLTLVADAVTSRTISPQLTYQSFNVDRVLREVEQWAMTRVQIIQGIRNWAVLLPILFTWIALATASAAYTASLAQDTTPTHELRAVPFLEQWEQGFSATTIPLGPINFPLAVLPHQFSTFAIFDFLLLATLIIMTIIGQFTESQALQRVEHVRAVLEQQLFKLASQTPIKNNADFTFEQRIAVFFEDNFLPKMLDLTKTIDQFNSGLNAIPSQITALLAASQEKTVTLLSVAASATHDQIEALAQQTGTLGTAAQSIREQWQIMGVQATQLTDGVITVRDAMTTINETVAQRIPALFGELNTTQTHLRISMEDLSTQYGSAVSSLVVAGQHIQTTSVDNHEAQQVMLAALSAMRLALTDMRTFVSEQNTQQTGTVQTTREYIDSTLVQITALTALLNKASIDLGKGAIIQRTGWLRRLGLR